MKWIKTNRFMMLKALGLFLGLTLSASQAFAAGTVAGTTVSNKATLDYQVGGTGNIAVESSPTGNTTTGTGNGTPTTFLVDDKVNVVVTTTDTTAVSVVPGQTNVVTTFSVTNTGNSPQGYLLTTANLAGVSLFGKTDNFDVSGCTILPTSIATLAPDASQAVTVSCTVPALGALATTLGGTGNVPNAEAVINLVAQTTAPNSSTPLANNSTTTASNGATVNVVFADAAGTDDIAKDGKSSSQDAYLVKSAVVSAAKTVSALCDPVNGTTSPKNIPGAIEQWTVTIASQAAGNANATLTNIVDPLDANTTLVGSDTPTAVCVAAGSTTTFSYTCGGSGSGSGTVGVTGASTATTPVFDLSAVNCGAGAGVLAPGQTVAIKLNVLIK